jgi:hypothetical protein
MKTASISRIIRAALLAGPAMCCALGYAACGGIIDRSAESADPDGSIPDATRAALDAHPDFYVPYDAVGAPEEDAGIVVDAGCTPEIDIDGSCPGQLSTAIVRTCAINDDCPNACKSFYKACNCDWGPPYSTCKHLDSGLFACACPGGQGGRWTARMEQRPLGAQTAGAFFAWMVWGESTSIHAFEVLERELRAHRAPRRLLAATRRAKRDEQRHTRIGLRLAKRYGVDADVANAPVPARVRTLEAIALENAVEACVSETWSALLARAQAERAVDPVVRRVFDRIATEEASHAALAWSIAGWSQRRLSARANARIQRETERAIAKLRDAMIDPAAELRMLGIPSREEQLAMLRVLEGLLWSPRAR